jgi:hypothetical protein
MEKVSKHSFLWEPDEENEFSKFEKTKPEIIDSKSAWKHMLN